jgi:hypothetical protein
LKNLKRIGIALCATALVVPAAVSANGPSGDHGNSGAPHGNANHPSKRCKHQPMVGYNYGGTLEQTSTASALVIKVTHASKAAKSLIGTDVTLSAADSAKANYAGGSPFDASGNPNAGVDLTTYHAQVNGKVGKGKKGCTFDNSPATVKHVHVSAPDTTGTDNTDQPQGTTQS